MNKNVNGVHELSIRVYYEDTDAGGIVYYANYLKFFERARTEWLRALGFEQDKLMEQSVAFVVKRVEMHNHAPARFNDLLRIHTELVNCKGASLEFKQIIKAASDTTVAEADIRIACVNLSNMTPMRIPADILGEISRVN